MANQEEKQQELLPPITNTNCHVLIFGSSGSGKTIFLKQYLDQTEYDYIVFGCDASEFQDYRYVEIKQLEKIKSESLVDKTITSDDAVAYKNLETKVEHLFRFRRHHNIQVLYLAH